MLVVTENEPAAESGRRPEPNGGACVRSLSFSASATLEKDKSCVAWTFPPMKRMLICFFRSSSATTGSAGFEGAPALNPDFVELNPPLLGEPASASLLLPLELENP
jgi:hypothetical protein